MKKVIFLSLFCVLSISTYAQKINPSYKLVATNDCGVESESPFLVIGDSYTFPDTKASDKALTCSFGNKVVYGFSGIDINSDMQLELLFFSDSRRVVSVSADGNKLTDNIVLEKGKEVRKIIELPKRAYAYGNLVLEIEKTEGPNAVVSEINIYASNPKNLVTLDKEIKDKISSKNTFNVETNLDLKKATPTYTPIPKSVTGIYNPVKSLNGIWKFKENPDVDFYTKDKANWSPITVPGQWSMQGFKVDSAGWGAYSVTFTTPNDWENKRIKIRFDGIHSQSKIYLNAKPVTEHNGGMTAFEVDITDNLKAGENTLDVAVSSETLYDALGSLTQYAAHQLGGITRNVTMFAVPEVNISDLRVVTDLDSEYNNAALKVFLKIDNEGNVDVKDHNVKIVLESLPEVIVSKIPEIKVGSSWSGWVECEVNSPLKWDNEHPNLYTAVIELSSGKIVTQQITKRIGFREVAIEGNRVLVNGIPIKLRGVNRHEVHPLTGRSLSNEFNRKDAEMFRDANCNFIRTSHYPPAQDFIDICDELGLFVELEAPLCWIGHGANLKWDKDSFNDPAFYDYMLQANMETVHLYRNHPSIIIWSLANESAWSNHFAQINEYVKQFDPTRPISFHDQAYGGYNNYGSTTSVANMHYPGPTGAKEAAKQTRPMTFGEYCHLNVYNRSEIVADPGVRSDWALALKPMWETMYKENAVLGGSIWSGIDDIFILPNGDAVGYGSWGPIDGWRRMKPEFWDMKKIFSPVQLLTQSLNPSNQLILEVENRYSFTDFNELRIEWQYGTEKGVSFIELAPSCKGELKINIKNPKGDNKLHIKFIDPKGFLTNEYVIPVGDQIQNKIATVDLKPTSLTSTPTEYIIEGDGFKCIVNRKEGVIKSLTKGAKELICGGPYLMALPLEYGISSPGYKADTPPLNNICTEWKANNVAAKKTTEGVEVTIYGSYKEFKGHFTLLINANGEINTSYDFNSKIDINPRQWGVVFDVPRTYDNMFFRRKGLWSIYPEDHIGRTEGVAKLFYDGTSIDSDPRTEPTWAWSKDCNALGSNDFRATRRDIWYAGLLDSDEAKIMVISNGTQHWRSWLENNVIRFLVADFASPGSEIFLEGYNSALRKPIKKGETISGKAHIRTETK